MILHVYHVVYQLFVMGVNQKNDVCIDGEWYASTVAASAIQKPKSLPSASNTLQSTRVRGWNLPVCVESFDSIWVGFTWTICLACQKVKNFTSAIPAFNSRQFLVSEVIAFYAEKEVKKERLEIISALPHPLF